MFGDHGKLYLLYSANRWFTNDYRVDYAVCEGPEGPAGSRPTTRCWPPTTPSAAPAVPRSCAPPTARRSSRSTRTWPDVGFPNKRQLHVEPLHFGADDRPLAGG